MRRTLPLSLLVCGLAVPASAGGSIERVSVSTAGSQGDAASGHGDDWGDISASGRYVVFASSAWNLAPGGAPAGMDAGATGVFLRDRRDGTTERLSGASGGAGPEISASGRHVLYRRLTGGLALLDRGSGRERSIPWAAAASPPGACCSSITPWRRPGTPSSS